MAGNARLAAVQALLQVHRDQGYSNVVLDMIVMFSSNFYL